MKYHSTFRMLIISTFVALIGLAAQPVQPAYAWALDCTDPANLAAMMIDQAQCESLESIYDNLGGGSWTNGNTGTGPGSWGEATDVDTWHGITRSGGTVARILLSNNNLTGNIQDIDLSGLTNLLILSLDDNQIGGNIDGLDLTGLINLELLGLAQNQIGGNIGGLDLTPASNLFYFSARFNQIGGNIDGLTMAGMGNLHVVFLDDNQIGGNINGLNLTGLGSLELLSLVHNQIGGSIDGLNLSGTPNLQDLNLWDNQIGGSIDGLNLTGLNNLGYLILADNQITGDPSGMPFIPASLELFLVGNNQLNGTVPDLTGTAMPPSSPGLPSLSLCGGANVVAPSSVPAINTFAESRDASGWLASTGCVGITPLVVTAACNGDDLDINITAGDNPFNIVGVSGPDLPQSGVGTGITTLTGPGSWSWISVTETGRDMETIYLGDFSCPVLQPIAATAACNGDNLNVTITAGDANFDISADDPAAANQAQNSVPAGTYTLISSSGYGTWTGITVNELGGDTETLNLADITCTPPTPGGSGGGGGGAAQAQTTACHVTIDVDADREAVSLGDQVVWTVLIRNPGPVECQGVQTYGTMPGEFSITDINTTRGSINWDGGQYYLVELGTLAVGDQVVVTLDSPLQGEAAFSLPEGAAAQAAGQQICLTGYITDPVNDIDCVTLFPDTLPATGGEPVNQSPNWGWLAAAVLLITGLGGYAIRRRMA